MGGTGSGFQGIRKDIVEDCLVLSVKDLAKIGVLDPGWHQGPLVWRSGEEQIAALEFSSSMPHEGIGSLWLRYTADGERMHYTVSLVSTVPHYGGRRWWLKCPIKGIRVAKLYLPPDATKFASRQAYDLTYRSCQVSGSVGRLYRRLARIKARMMRTMRK